jgi:hypothetical protein
VTAFVELLVNRGCETVTRWQRFQFTLADMLLLGLGAVRVRKNTLIFRLNFLFLQNIPVYGDFLVNRPPAGV